MDATQSALSVNEQPTIKTQAVSPASLAKNEKEYAQMQYNIARQNMLDHPHSELARKQFEDANNFLYYVQDAYRLGAKLKYPYRKLRYG